MVKIVVWGMGTVGKKWLNVIRTYRDDIDVEIVAVTDSDVDITLDETEKHLFITNDKLHTLQYDYIIVASKKYYEEIREKLLHELGVKDDKIVYCNEFLEKANIIPKYECNMCGNKNYWWNYCGVENELFSSKQVTGAGYRKGVCPVCGAMDRERYVYSVLHNHTDILEAKQILHFAPEKELKKVLSKIAKEYVTADIVPGRADVVADITKLQFEDNSFDYVICNHVLEHILDESAALSEVKRCLKENGKFIVTVPICWHEKTFEDSKIVSEEDRTKFYGQKDHVRLYGNDIVEKFEQYGFKVTYYKNDSNEYDKKYGFLRDDCVFILDNQK